MVGCKKMQLPKSSRQKESENAEQVDVAERLRCLFALIANGIFSRQMGEVDADEDGDEYEDVEDKHVTS